MPITKGAIRKQRADKIKKEINFGKIEKKLERKINIMIIESLNKLDRDIINKIHNGMVLHGELNG